MVMEAEGEVGPPKTGKNFGSSGSASGIDSAYTVDGSVVLDPWVWIGMGTNAGWEISKGSTLLTELILEDIMWLVV
ncbi:unnamed protein product [Periconia digitata]|uniref:Uncharacterized protein n=1 Tax=Periconia digitata TaxID=1303443 RepID=A0A9W4UVW6_9PLEO|nr:unnamed protein product [Periconia digitata]